MHGVGTQQRIERSTARRRNFERQYAEPAAGALRTVPARPADSDFSRLYAEMSSSHTHPLDAEFQHNHAALQRLTSGFAALQAAVLERELGANASADDAADDAASRAQQWRSYRTPERLSGSDVAASPERIREAGTQTFGLYPQQAADQAYDGGACGTDFLLQRPSALTCKNSGRKAPAMPAEHENERQKNEGGDLAVDLGDNLNESSVDNSGSVSVEDEYVLTNAVADALRQSAGAQKAAYKAPRQQHNSIFYQRLEAFLGRQTPQNGDSKPAEKAPAERPAHKYLDDELAELSAAVRAAGSPSGAVLPVDKHSRAYYNAAAQPGGQIRIEELTVINPALNSAVACQTLKAQDTTDAPAIDLDRNRESVLESASQLPGALYRSAAAPLRGCESMRADEIARQRLSSVVSLRGMRQDIEELMRAFSGDVARSVIGDEQVGMEVKLQPVAPQNDGYCGEEQQNGGMAQAELENRLYKTGDILFDAPTPHSDAAAQDSAAAEQGGQATGSTHICSEIQSVLRESDVGQAIFLPESAGERFSAEQEELDAGNKQQSVAETTQEDAEYDANYCQQELVALADADAQRTRLQIVPMQPLTEPQLELQPNVTQQPMPADQKLPEPEDAREAAAWPLAVSELHELIEEQAEMPALSPLLPQKYVVDASVQQTSLAASPVVEAPKEPQTSTDARPAPEATAFENKTPESEFPVFYHGASPKFDSFGLQPPASLNINSATDEDVYSQLLTSPKSCVLASSPVEQANQQFAAEFLRSLVQAGLVYQGSVFPHKSYSRGQIVRLRKLKSDFAVAEKQARKKQYGDKFEQFYRTKLQQIAAEAVCLLAEEPTSRRSSTTSQRAKLLM